MKNEMKLEILELLDKMPDMTDKVLEMLRENLPATTAQAEPEK